jgi:hypothetical protein
VKVEGPRKTDRLAAVEAVLHRVAALEPLGDDLGRQVPAGPAIERGTVRVEAYRMRRNLAARAEAGIEQPQFAQPVGMRRVDGKARRLHHHGFRPVEAEPAQVLEDRLGKFGFTARGVRVFQTQQHGAAEPFRPDFRE